MAVLSKQADGCRGGASAPPTGLKARPYNIVVGVLLAIAVAVPVETQQPTFRSGAQLTIVDVTVTGKDGRPIEGLTASDFALTEDGVPQTISMVAFQRVDSADAAALPPLPPTPPRPQGSVAPTVQPQISASPAGEIRYRNRRLLVLYFDLSAMPPADQARAYSAARKFLAEQITAQDLVAVMTFQGGAVRVKQDFTSDARRSRRWSRR
jgi:VWFA-related protein